jgi:hypothetical protein
MSATLAAAPNSLFQTAFWPPDRELSFARLARRRSVSEGVQPASVASGERSTATSRKLENFPCSWPECARGAASPFPSAAQLANHRFAAHGIRSTNEDSIRRQERRDKKRALSKETVPEYIDASKIRADVQKRFTLNLPRSTRNGALDAGDREHVRRRLCYLITVELQRELKRAPAELCVAIAELAAMGLAPSGLQKSVRPRATDAFSVSSVDQSGAGLHRRANN